MEEIRKNLTLYGRKIVEKGLVSGAGGNISVRSGNYLLLSPSGFFLDELYQHAFITKTQNLFVEPIQGIFLLFQ